MVFFFFLATIDRNPGTNEATQLSELLRFSVTDILPSRDVVQRVIPKVEEVKVPE